MDGSEEECFCSPPLAEGDEEFLVLPDSAPVVQPRGAGRIGRPRAPETSGVFGAWLVRDLALGTSCATIASSDAGDVAHRSVLGLAQCSWEYKPTTHTETSAARGPGAGLGAEVDRAFGMLTYSFDELFLLDQPFQIPPTVELNSPTSCLRLGMLCADSLISDLDMIIEDFEDASELLYTHVIVESEETVGIVFFRGVALCVSQCAVGQPGALGSFDLSHAATSSYSALAARLWHVSAYT